MTTCRTIKKGIYADTDINCQNCDSLKRVCTWNGECENLEPITNEEWIKSLDTEQLADKLTDFSFWLVPTLPSEERHEYIRKKMMEWLKEKHEVAE